MRDSDDIGVNTSSAPHFQSVIATRLARRDALKGLVSGVATAALAPSLVPLFASDARADVIPVTVTTPDFGFTDISHGRSAEDVVAPGHRRQVLIRWGDPVFEDAPAFDPVKQTARDQERQFGYNNDFVAYLPFDERRGLLWVNHEYTQLSMMKPGISEKTGIEALTPELAALEMAAHGGTLIEIERSKDGFRVLTDSPRNRRITATTPITISGPAAGDARMRTSADPEGRQVLGMIGNCAGGVTPWGTILTCEENFSFYFMGEAPAGEAGVAYKRYGVGGKARYGWGKHEARFDLAREPNEANRFGWVVEIDPSRPNAPPVKRTALGRFKHEAATCALAADGRVVVYSGDDERNEYVYRFVSAKPFDRTNYAANRDLLDKGTLSVARFDANGTLTWLPLIHGQGPLTEANGFKSQADVVIEARRAADLLGATPMDRPEDIETSPTNGRVYVVLTNNKERPADKVNAANPRAKNIYGHILELIPDGAPERPDHGADRVTWDIFLMGGPLSGEGAGKYGKGTSENGWLACPDNIAFDPAGRLWIATDQGKDQQSFGIGDGLYACKTVGEHRAATRFFYRVPTGAETCGPCFTADGSALFVAVQHPGGDDDGSSFDTPSTRWPDFNPAMPPRPSVVVITREGGGPIGA